MLEMKTYKGSRPSSMSTSATRIDDYEHVIRIEEMRLNFENAKDIWTGQNLDDKDEKDWLLLSYGKAEVE